MMTLVFSGLGVQAAALVLGFTRVGWRWPMVGAGTLVSLGFLLTIWLDGGRLEGLPLAVVLFSILVLGLAGGHAASAHPAVAWPLRAGIIVQALLLLLLVAFFLFFQMDRLF
jgi:hypothetical protein